MDRNERYPARADLPLRGRREDCTSPSRVMSKSIPRPTEDIPRRCPMVAWRLKATRIDSAVILGRPTTS